MAITPAPAEGQELFVRGDANGDHTLNIADAVFSLNHLFLGGSAPCLDALDANDSGGVDLADPISVLGTLFSGDPPLPPPGPTCGLDLTNDPLDCLTGGSCPGVDRDAPLFPHLALDAPAQRLEFADFDGDGILDLLGLRTGSLRLALGLGSGRFAPSASIPSVIVGRFAIGDLEGDGTLDIVGTNSLGDSVRVLRGNGDGTFAPEEIYSTGDDPRSISLVDLDGDGLLDLITGNRTSATASILTATPLGSFTGPVNVPLAAPTLFASVADLNADGAPDLVSSQETPETIEVFLGDGLGGFLPGVAYPTGGRSREHTIADFDGDGVLDVVLSNEIDNELALLSGDGLGGLAAPVTIAVPGRPTSLRVGDFDGDPIADLLVVRSTSGSVQVFHGDPSLGLIAGAVSPRPTPLADCAIADLDGDGVLDAAFAPAGVDPVEVEFGSTESTFPSRLGLVGVPSTIAVENGDFDGDGALDFLITNLNTPFLFRGLGDGTFEPRVGIGGSPEVVDLEIADVNADGLDDVVFTSGTGVGVFLGDPIVGLQSAMLQTLGPLQYYQCSVGDVNGDGDLDFVVQGRDFPGVPSEFTVFIGDGTGGFSASGTGGVTGVTGGFDTHLADLDLDGNLDVVMARDFAGGRLSVWSGNGDGTFTPVSIDSPFPTSPPLLTIRDLNGDGFPDVVATDAFNTIVRLSFGNGDLSFQPQIIVTPATPGNGVSVGDLDLDGDLDLVVTEHDTPTIQVLRNDALGVFTPTEVHGGTPVTSPGRRHTSLGDFDGDGDLDCVVTNFNGTLEFYPNTLIAP